MKITIIFPCDDPETSRDMAMAIVMPLAPTLLAVLTPRELVVAAGSFFTQYGIHRSIPKAFGQARRRRTHA